MCVNSNKFVAIAGYRKSIYTLLCIFAAWLHLSAGLSRDAASVVLKICKILIAMSLNLGLLIARMTISAGSITATSESTSHPALATATTSFLKGLPTDVRTAVSALSIDPVLQRSVCCPRCMARYELANLPERCYWRESSRSAMCKESLWTTRQTNGGPRAVPRRLYSTQDPDSWLEFFLSRPGIEDSIAASYEHTRRTDGRMNSIRDSPAWKSLGGFTTTKGNLTFSFFIDWFNPLTNKIAGKSVSCGAIMMVCLNLPHELQHLPENTFFVGITPPPKEPTVTSITHLLDPVMERFDYLFRVGKSFRTFNCPNGCHFRIAILPAIGDLLAMRKALGFAGVASNRHFCAICKLHKNDIEELDTSKFTPRDGTEAKIAAQEWHDAPTKKARDALLREHGVRWTSLHLLDYRDPVKHTVLGLMHNWIEGVLQHHTRVFWGVGVTKADSKGKQVVSSCQDDDARSDITATPTPDDVGHSGVNAGSFHTLMLDTPIDDEVDMLYEQVKKTAAVLNLDVTMNDDSNTETSSVSGFDSDLESEHRSELMDDEDFREECEGDDDAPGPQVFSEDEMRLLRKGLSEIVTPSYLARLPSNFGEAAHGKLKADQWLVAFTVYFPLILPEIWLHDGTRRKMDLLDNFEMLVACTNIVCAYSITNEDADRYTMLYSKYRRSARDLYANSRSRPNHHYAMHNGPLLKFWGPLVWLSEFPYETFNGTLQRIKTNNHLCES